MSDFRIFGACLMGEQGQAEAVPLSGGIRAYARHRGTSHTAVQRAIRGRRLVKSLSADSKGAVLIDFAVADAEWEAHTDLSRAPGYVKERPAVSAPPPTKAAQPPVARVPAGVSALAEASAREKHWNAEIKQLEYLEAAGELVKAAPLEARWTDRIVQCKTKLLGVPSKAKHALPHLTHSDVRVLDELIRQALEDLADAAVAHGRTEA